MKKSIGILEMKHKFPGNYLLPPLAKVARNEVDYK